jgi:hypothetical protein
VNLIGCLLVGDFNCPDIDWVNDFANGDCNQKAFYNTTSDLGHNQYVTTGTRGNNILNQVLCNDLICCGENPADEGSNHVNFQYQYAPMHFHVRAAIP